jgi:hypothetical protein
MSGLGRWGLLPPLLVASLVLAGGPSSATASTSSAVTTSLEEPAYVTLLFGRSQLGMKTPRTCQVLPGSVSLHEVAEHLGHRGLSAVGTVVVNYVHDTRRTCRNSFVYPSWSDLAVLRDRHGWSFVSSGMNHADLNGATLEEQRAESCGSLPSFEARGHHRAWGLFAHGGARNSAQAQRDVVSTCFSFGRQYRQLRTERSSIGPPWWQETFSVLGGRCRDATDPCASMEIKNNRVYQSPEVLANHLQVEPGQWAVLQAYRLVTGSRQEATGATWDCTSDDWQDHWTSKPEMYCLVDYLAAVDTIPSTAVVTDPATVAAAWGRGR